jgi:spore maturation protein CgeB
MGGPSNCLINRGVPSKFVDCIASGGFALVDPKPDLRALFGQDIEAVFFRDADELNSKIEYFLARPQERREVVEGLRAVVERECTLNNLMGRVLEAIDDESQSSANSDV